MTSMDTDLIEVTGVNVLGHYRLRLTFSDGRVGDVDVSDAAHKGNLYADLRDPAYFAKVRVDPEVGTIAWPNGLDFAPERLYREAVTRGGDVVSHAEPLSFYLRSLGVDIARLLRMLAHSIGHSLRSRTKV
jgi:hypothetical protein